MIKKPIILIIAPHSCCKKMESGIANNYYRSCDELAKKGANLFEKIVTNLGFETKKFLSDKIRISEEGNVLVDYNRKEFRNTEWRNKIVNYIEEQFINGRDLFIFEIHSFPNNDTEFNDSEFGLVANDTYLPDTTRLFTYLNNNTIFNILGDSDGDRNILRDIVNDNSVNEDYLNDYFNNRYGKPIDIRKIISTDVVDIMNQTAEISKKQLSETGKTNIKRHLLLEFNEDLGDNAVMNTLFNIFLYQIKNLNKQIKYINGYVILSFIGLIFLLYYTINYSKFIDFFKPINNNMT